MNIPFHAPSFGDDLFDMGDGSTSTPTSSFVGGNHHNNINSSYTYQQTPPSTKRLISAHDTSDEYHTANEESFKVTANKAMNSPIIQQNINTQNNAIAGEHAGMSSTAGQTTAGARKQMSAEQSEPAKPLSAYALFFRDTVSAIKQQNPTCSFQELSKIVASMWDALDPVHKGVYNKKNELARIEYLKQMRIYQQQKQEQLNANANEIVQVSDASAQQPIQQVTQPLPNNINVQQNAEQINNNVATNINTNPAATTTTSTNSSAPSEDQMRLLTEAGSAQKCTRENCNKRAIINPDWEDEYCSNECVIIHCRNVFNDWVQSNIEAKKQQQQQPAAAQ